MRYLSLLILLFLSLNAALPAFAQNAEPANASITPESGEAVDILPQDAIFLGESEENGVMAMAWIYRVPNSENQTGDSRQYPYLLFTRFLSVDSNIRIEKGLVAYKLETYDDEKTPARKMEFKNGYFVAGLDSVLVSYPILHVGCKLEDDKKRQFKFMLKTY